MTTIKQSLPKDWRWAKLGDICEQDRRIIEPNSVEATRLIYLGLEYIESNTGRILREPAEPINNDEGKSTSFAFDTRHVLYGKLRPYLNKVALPEFEGRCTTELIPLLPKEADRNFLAWLLRRSETVSAAMQGKTGSRMPRANMDELLTLEIPVPPLDEQKRIAARLDEQMRHIEQARQAAEESLSAAWDLPSAYLLDIFEHLSNSEFLKRSLGDFILSYHNGFGRRPKELEKDGVIVLRLADITGGIINLDTPRRVDMSKKELEAYQVTKGDLLFVRVNGSKELVGRCAVFEDVGEPIAYNDHIIRIKLNDEIFPDYAKLITETKKVRDIIVEKASTSAGQLTINQETIGSIEIPLIPIDKQKKLVEDFSVKLKTANQLQKSLESQLAEINELPSALLRQAFAGGV